MRLILINNIGIQLVRMALRFTCSEERIWSKEQINYLATTPVSTQSFTIEIQKLKYGNSLV